MDTLWGSAAPCRIGGPLCVITRWRGGTYLFGAPRNEHVSPPTYLSEGLTSAPPIPARNDLRNDKNPCKNRDGDKETRAQLRDQVEEALAAGRAHHGRVATADVRRQTEGTKRRRAGDQVPGTHAMM